MSNNNETNSSTTKNSNTGARVAQLKDGVLTVTVWANKSKREDDDAIFHSVSVERSYKGHDGEWRTTRSFRPWDLPRLVVLLNKAFALIPVRKSETEEETAA